MWNLNMPTGPGVTAGSLCGLRLPTSLSTWTLITLSAPIVTASEMSNSWLSGVGRENGRQENPGGEQFQFVAMQI